MPNEFWEGQKLVRSLYEKYMGAVCAEHGLTRIELDILLFLANNPQSDTASDIVEQRLLTKSHVSTSIKALAERGFLSKSYAPDNRKTIHLSLCDAAGPAVADGRNAQNRFFSILFQGFSAEERQELRSYFLRISANLKNHYE